ncbi:hypothetical protein [Paracoccus sp. AS002]|uniref:hypothetical protein n=1 Tax=Paracoccus sp. AS002 TaxID=3019545 RepID=UPI0023E8F0F8|nr:hypothetical protein [Paracoccus sp. AS002]MDF3907614.1 hypothetical protein [Paracoccus sp. AS002]
MPEVKHTADDVFGVSRDVPLNYVDREAVDGKFIQSLTRSHHIVIFGSSKQGKTCLRKHCLNSDDYITVSCQNKWSLGDLHAAILKRAGYEVKQSTSHAVGGHYKLAASASAEMKLPLVAKGGVDLDGQYERDRSTEEVRVTLELDPLDANDIIMALQEINFRQYVAIEDFHYLPDQTQRDFSFALKTFHEQSKISFIITGVWREQNRLIAFNGDLTERVFSVDVDNWSRDDLARVIEAGESLMNLQFAPDFKEVVLSECNDSVHMVQEACRRACRESGVYETADNHPTVGSADIANELLKQIVDEQGGRYNGFIMNFADGFQQTELEMPKWIIYSVLSSSIDDLEKGIRLREITRIIREKHPRGQRLNAGNVTQALSSATSLQSEKGIRPIVIDYDGTNRNLHVVDKGFLIWLAHQDRSELIADLDLIG